MNQVHELTWHTAVFRTLNEARRLEPHRTVNGVMWELITAGYANLMTLGIRRLVDKDDKTDSVPNIIARIERRPELLTREQYICYDGLPYDHEAVEKRHVESLDLSAGGHVGWLPTKGPDAWATSKLLHTAFDALSGYPAKRNRGDAVQPKILADLKDSLRHPTIKKVCTMAEKRFAHAERIAEGSGAVPAATYDDIDVALRIIVRVANFLSTAFFFDATFGSVVATPQFDMLEALDQPWATTETIPALHRHWHDLSAAMNQWAYNTNEGFLPPTVTGESQSSAPDHEATPESSSADNR